MNVDRALAAAVKRVPAKLRGTVVFIDGDRRTSGTAVGVPAKPGMTDGWVEGAAIREKGRRLAVLPHGLAFEPASGMAAEWEGRTWTVLGANAAKGDGSTALLYRVTLST